MFFFCSGLEGPMKDDFQLSIYILDLFMTCKKSNMAASEPKILYFYQIQWAENCKIYLGSAQYGTKK